MAYSIERMEKFAEKAHQTAVEKGWWDGEDRDNRELLALIHSEISEALEEYRSNHGMVWYADNDKPEGIAIELIDAVIRICDFMKHRGLAFKKPFDESAKAKLELPVLAAILHAFISSLILDEGISFEDGSIINDFQIGETMSRFCCIVHDWLDIRGFDMWQLLEIKHSYNQTRPYRHGNKVC